MFKSKTNISNTKADIMKRAESITPRPARRGDQSKAELMNVDTVANAVACWVDIHKAALNYTGPTEEEAQERVAFIDKRRRELHTEMANLEADIYAANGGRGTVAVFTTMGHDVVIPPEIAARQAAVRKEDTVLIQEQSDARTAMVAAKQHEVAKQQFATLVAQLLNSI